MDAAATAAMLSRRPVVSNCSAASLPCEAQAATAHSRSAQRNRMLNLEL
jgi:hypothetical protein